MAHTVFICHSARDKQVADAACAAIEARRIPCWIAPRDILGGDEWGESIVNAINQCRVFLLIFSAHANASPQVHREIERALSKGKVILPFRIEDVQPTGAMEYALGNTHWLDALMPPLEASLIQLADTVDRIVQREKPSPSPPFGPLAPQPIQGDHPPGAPKTAPANGDSASSISSSAIKTTHPRSGTRKLVPLTALTVIVLAAASFVAWLQARKVNATDLFQRGDELYRANRYEEARPLLQAACDHGSAPACTDLGWMYHNGKAVPKDYIQAVMNYRKACDGGDLSGCDDLGSMYDNGEGVSKDSTQAAALYRRVCDGGNAEGCHRLGFHYEFGEGIQKDYTNAVVYYRKACDGGDFPACSGLGVMYDNGQGVSRDITQAFALFRKSCEGGSAEGCENLGIMYENGEGMPKDYIQAVANYRKACDGGDLSGCDNLGSMYQNGEGVSKDFTQAVALYSKACEGGETSGCQSIKRLHH